MLITRAGKKLYLDPSMTPIKMTRDWDDTGDLTVEHHPKRLYVRFRFRPIIFGGKPVKVKEFALGWCPLNSQHPVLILAAQDWNHPYSEEV